jgi:hypothetical protein
MKDEDREERARNRFWVDVVSVCLVCVCVQIYLIAESSFQVIDPLRSFGQLCVCVCVCVCGVCVCVCV